MDFVDDQIKRVFKISTRQCKKLKIILTAYWSLLKDDVFIYKEDGSDTPRKYLKCKIQFNQRSSFIQCFDDEDKEHCFIFPNNRFKIDLDDKLTSHERGLLISKLKDVDMEELQKRFISQTENKNDNLTLMTLSCSDRRIHDKLLSEYVTVK